MCGINGIVTPRGRGAAVTAGMVQRMRDVLRHRGPDDAGMFCDGRVGLGHRRLSIVDVQGGHQPMTNEDDTIHIVYNGEVYNHAELRPDLERRGHRYRTRADTETIIHLYEEQGAGCVEYLRGMFAFAIWDAPREQLLLARDRLGIKPLYYALQPNGTLLFASEMKAILAAGGVTPELNYRALPDYLANHAPSGEETLFQNIRRLPAGHVLTWHEGRIAIERYWDLPQRQEAAELGRPEAAIVDEWLELFREAVRLRLMSDVPLGMFLSGGIDSAAILAVMSGLVDAPIQTFSVAFAERSANELAYARLAAQAFGSDHREVLLDPAAFFAALPDLIWHEDEPIAHPSSVALNAVARLAGEHVKVVLTGEGSDELLAGYGRYARTLLNHRLGTVYERWTPAALRRGVQGAIGRLPLSARAVQKLRRTFLYLPADLASIYFDNFAVFGRDWQTTLLTPATYDHILSAGGTRDPYLHQHQARARWSEHSLLEQLLYVDQKTYLQELLMKQDQMSMAASIESRVPFLDHVLVEHTVRLADRWKLRRQHTKHILRRAMRGILPTAILQRRKMGFPVPVGMWFRQQYRGLLDEYVLGERALERGLFRPDVVRTLVREHEAGVDHAERLWALVNLELWQRRFLDGEEAARPAAVAARTASR